MDSFRSPTDRAWRARVDTQLAAARDAFGSLVAAARRAESQLLAVTLPSRVVFMLAAGLGGWALAVYYTDGITMLQGDSIGHLFIARRMIDSITPSATGLGGIWLPLPHLLMLPLIWSDTMWRTGLAGSVISSLVYAGSAVYVHRLVTAISRSGLAGLLAAAIFATNPNMLFMQSTPMTEPLAVFLLVGAAFHLTRWAQDDLTLHLIVSALFVLAATLTRYEAWILAPVGVGIIVLAAWRRHKSWGRAEAYALVWGMLAGYGIVVWMIYNLVIFGDPLNFGSGEFTGAALAADLDAAGLLPYKGHPLLASATYGWSVVDTLGLPLVLTGVAGFAALMVSRIPIQVKLAAVLPFWVFVFEVASLTGGGSGMSTPHASPSDLENTRYGLLMLPAAVIAAGALVRPIRSLGIVLLLATLLPQLFVLSGTLNVAAVAERDALLDQAALTGAWKSTNFPFLSGDRPIVVTDAAHAGGFSRQADAPGDWLREHAPTGRILISTARNDAATLMMRARFDVARFIHESTKPYFDEEIARFGTHADWIVFEPLEPNDAFQALMARAHPAGFQMVYDSGHFQIYKKEQPVGALARPPGVPWTATPVREDRLLGNAVDPTVPFSERHVISLLECPFGLLTLRTNKETLYAEMPCGGVLTPERMQVLQNATVRLRTQVSPKTHMIIDLPSGETIDLPARRLWIELAGKPVPAGAELVVRETTFGRIDASADALDVRLTYAISCAHEVLAIATTREVLYAEFPCNDVPAGLVASAAGRAVSLQITPAEDATLRIEPAGGSTVELRTGRVWVLPFPPPSVLAGSAPLLDGVVIGDDGKEALSLASCNDDGIGIVLTTYAFLAETHCRRLEQLLVLANQTLTITLVDGEQPILVLDSRERGVMKIPVSRVWARALRP